MVAYRPIITYYAPAGSAHELGVPENRSDNIPYRIDIHAVDAILAAATGRRLLLRASIRECGVKVSIEEAVFMEVPLSGEDDLLVLETLSSNIMGATAVVDHLSILTLFLASICLIACTNTNTLLSYLCHVTITI